MLTEGKKFDEVAREGLKVYMELLLCLEGVKILLRAAQLVEEERVFLVSEVDDKRLLLAGVLCCVQGYLDLKILSEIFAVLSPQSHCNLALVKRTIELELVF